MAYCHAAGSEPDRRMIRVRLPDEGLEVPKDPK